MESISWKCSTCGKIIKHQKVSADKKEHTEVKKYPCNKCSKTFDRNKNLIRHKKVCSPKQKN